MTPAALYVRRDSIYKAMGLDCWDADRDALGYEGEAPVIAHPPCRAWGRLRTFAKPSPGERFLGIHAVQMVRCFGGVLEHPASSLLWKMAGLPPPGAAPDAVGGWTLGIKQGDFGHLAEKDTWLYIVGATAADLPVMPLRLGEAPYTIGKWSGRDRSRQRPECSRRQREATPPAMAEWLVSLASICRRPQ